MNNDSISRQKTIEEVDKYFDGLPIQGHYDIVQIIKNMPTIEPIRCGECIHHDAEISLCYYHNMRTTEGWFCADGERLVK